MSEQDSSIRFAWEPITPPGVAAFAHAPVWRLLFVQLIFALAEACLAVWFLQSAWFPTITSAIEQLPARGEIRDGALNWPSTSPQLLAEGNFLAFVVDLDHQGQLQSPAHVQVEFGRRDIRIISLLGYSSVAYPPHQVLGFNRNELGPKWGAWRPPILWMAFGLVLAFLIGSWTGLATVYFLPVWFTGYFGNRQLSLAASWKLAGASLMPGAVLLSLAIACYGLGSLDPFQLAAAFGMHFVVGWIYIFTAPAFVPKLETTSAAPSGNPFASPPQPNQNAAEPPAENPSKPKPS